MSRKNITTQVVRFTIKGGTSIGNSVNPVLKSYLFTNRLLSPASLSEEVAEIGYGVGNSYFTLVIWSFYFRNNLYCLFGVKAVGIIGK